MFMKKPLSIGKLQKVLWQECRRVANTLYVKPQCPTTCFTCGKVISGSNKQLGHFLPKSVCGATLKYDMRNLRWQCYYCNINLGGNGAVFYKNLVEKEGQEYVDELFRIKNTVSIKAYDKYLELLQEYQKIPSIEETSC
jgi:hypothetical protein